MYNNIYFTMRAGRECAMRYHYIRIRVYYCVRLGTHNGRRSVYYAYKMSQIKYVSM